jgi:Zn-dependent protease
MFEHGYFQLGRWRGVPVRVHWTLPLGALFFGGMRFVPAFWIGFFVLVLIHELGHAALVKRFGHAVLAVDITGFGGLCRWRGYATERQRSIIAWGGVVAQAVALVATLLLLAIFGWPHSWFLAQLANVFVYTNLWLIGFNLLPIPPFDGAQAWALFQGGRGGRWRFGPR